MGDDKKSAAWYLGVDVGGTKILGAMVKANGKVVARKRVPTPRDTSPHETAGTILQVMEELLAEDPTYREGLQAIGLAVPGITDQEEGRVVVTPNMNLTGLRITPMVSERFGVPVALGNDVNLGTLGEKWMGSAAHADSAVGIFVGTGIGGGVIVNGRLVEGFRGAAGEIGHMLMLRDGPLCGCGHRGCLEALASRTAIEREIRMGVELGRKTVLTELIGHDLSIIRSSMLKRALLQGDELVEEVMRHAAETLGAACLTIRHMIDPEVIVLGGGVVEACDFFVLPIVEEAVASDPLPGARPGGHVVGSTLGDDAVVLGAVALAQQLLGCDALPRSGRSGEYPAIAEVRPGHVAVADKVYEEDVVIRADGRVKKRRKVLKLDGEGLPGRIDPDELQRVCKGRPNVLIIGSGYGDPVELSDDGREFLRQRGIAFEVLPTADAVNSYNATEGRKAALLRVT